MIDELLMSPVAVSLESVCVTMVPFGARETEASSVHA